MGANPTVNRPVQRTEQPLIVRVRIYLYLLFRLSCDLPRPESYLLSAGFFALLGFGFCRVMVTLTFATVASPFTAFSKSRKAFSMFSIDPSPESFGPFAVVCLRK